MNWLQIELPATPEQLEYVEQALLAAGAVAVSLVSDADEPVLEPDPGQTPLWSRVRVQALFDLQADMSMLKQQLDQIEGLDRAALHVQFLADSDWQAAARTHAVNQVFGGRLWLLPKGGDGADASAEPPSGVRRDQTELVRLYLEPGMAFGSGSHPTTSLCLQWLAEHVQPGCRLLDFGCGSGVLGIAAALLGATVVAVDHDAQAVVATAENAAYNGVPDASLAVLHTDQWRAADHTDQFDVVVANILAGPLCELAGEFLAVAKPRASIVLSGILAEQAQQVMAHYSQLVFDPPWEQAGWVCLHGARG